MNKLQLFCFTCAGGNASFFSEIEKDLPDLEIVKLEYSGHGSRHKEKLYDNFDELSSDMLSQISHFYNGGKYALFGYSMGSVSLVETLKKIVCEEMLPIPIHVFLAAHEPYTKSELLGFSPRKLDDWVKERTIKFGAVPNKLIYNSSFWRVYLPLYRADYTIIGKYDFNKLTIEFKIPATIFYSETDTPYKDMLLWTKYFIDTCDFYRFDGKHFFIQQHHSEMADIIRSKLIDHRGKQ